VPFDEGLAADLCEATALKGSGAQALELTKHVDKRRMAVVQDEHCLALGRRFVDPLVGSLFADSERARANWSIYGVNRYETGGSFGSHRDSVGATVLIVTASGLRDFSVFEQEGSDGLNQIERTFELGPGSVMILDGQLDPRHAVSCRVGPSVSAVLDVPDLLRT
jgi:alkylated DNA repair dioxygenase AlkB